MTLSKSSRASRNEEKIEAHLSSLGVNSMQDVEELPFDNINQANQALNDKVIEVGTNYSPDTLEKFGSDNQYWLHSFLTIVPVIVMVVCVILGFIGDKKYFWGILFALIGFFGTRKGGAVIGLGIMAMIGCALGGNWIWAKIISAAVVSSFAVALAKGISIEYIKARAFESESLFLYFFLTRRIYIRYTETKKIIEPIA